MRVERIRDKRLNKWDVMIPILLRFLRGGDYGSVLTNTANLHFPNLLQQIMGLGSLFRTKSQIIFSLAIQTTQQVVS
mgnify:CR=1 FL=1